MDCATNGNAMFIKRTPSRANLEQSRRNLLISDLLQIEEAEMENQAEFKQRDSQIWQILTTKWSEHQRQAKKYAAMQIEQEKIKQLASQLEKMKENREFISKKLDLLRKIDANLSFLADEVTIENENLKIVGFTGDPSFIDGKFVH